MKYWKLTSLIIQILCFFLFLSGIVCASLKLSDVGRMLIAAWFYLGGIQIIDTLVQLYNAKKIAGLSNRKWHGIYLIVLLIIGLIDGGALIWALAFTSPVAALIILFQTKRDYKYIINSKSFEHINRKDSNDIIEFI